MNSDFSKLSKEERELRLTALALGELAPAEAEETHQAIAADADLAREFERLKQTVGLVRETAAMDRRVSPEGVPLKLDDTRRQKLLEAFKTPAPRAIEPRRRRKLWFVPMSAAAAVVGLLIAVMALPHIRGVREAERVTMLFADNSDGVYAGESASKRLLGRLFTQPSERAGIEGQEFVTLPGLAATETPAPKPVPLLKATKSLAIALPTGGDKDGDGLADRGWGHSERRADLGAASKPVEALNEFSVSSDFAVGRKLEVKRGTGAVRGQEVHIDVDSAGRVYLGNSYGVKGIADKTPSPQQSSTIGEVMYDSIPETAPVLVQADGMNNTTVTVNFSETKGLAAGLQREENAPGGSRPFGEPTWIGMVDRPVATTAPATTPPATPPPANAPEQAGATVYSVNAAGYANTALKSGGSLIANPTTSANDSVEAFKSGGAVVNFAKETKPESGLNVNWDINGIAAKETGLSRPNAQSAGVTAPTQPGSQPLLENAAGAGMASFYRLQTEPAPARLSLNNNRGGDAGRPVPIFKIEPKSGGQAVANGTADSYLDLNRNRSGAAAAKDKPMWSGMTQQGSQSEPGVNKAAIVAVPAAEWERAKADDYEKTPHPESTEALATTAPGPNRTEAAKFVQDGKLFYESGRLKEAEEALRQATKIDPDNKSAAYYGDLVTAKKYDTEARLGEVNSKQSLSEVEQAWSAPVARFQASGQAGTGPTPGAGGATPFAQDSIAPSGRGGGGRGGGGRANKTSGISAGGFLGGSAGQPAKPETQIAIGDIDSLSNAGEVVAMTPQQLTIDAKFANVNQDGFRALGIDSPRGDTALKNQILDQDRAVRSANLATIYHDLYMDGASGALLRSDDGTVVFQNSYAVPTTNGLVSNNSWPGASTTNSFFAVNDSSWVGKDGREKLPAGTYTFALGDQQVSDGEKPVSVDYGLVGGSAFVVHNSSVPSSAGALHNIVTVAADDTIGSPAEFPATAGDKTFAANQSGLGSAIGSQGPAIGRGFGVAQSQPGGGVGAGGFGRSGFGNRLNSAVRRLEGATVATTRGTDDFGTASTGAGDQTVRLVNGAVRGSEIQLPAQAKEEPLNRQSGPARPPNEGTTAHFFGPRNLIGEDRLGVDAAGLPIADVEAKVKKLDQVALRGEGIVAEEKLEGRVQAATKETDLDQALADYARLTGKTMLKSPQVQTKAKISIPNLEQLSEVERATALAKVLGENQIALIPDGEKSLKVVPQGSVAQEAAPIETKQTALPKPNAYARTNISSNGQVSARITDHEKAGEQPQPIVDRAPTKPALPAPTPQPEVLARDDAFSTFSLNVSDVSFKLAAASLEKGAMPEVANIRSEEFINAFDYHDPMPAPGAPLAFAWERARYPFAHNRDVVRFSVKTAAQGRETGRPLNIVLLLDNSGSMERADRVRIIQESLRTLAAQLKPQDKLSVVTFSRTARLWADGVSGAQAAEVANKIGTLTPEGGTNLEDALDLAYKTALRHYLATAVNRVVLLTDGAANLGNVEPKELKAKVEGFRKQGIALDCFGIGWEGFNDDLLEQLSRNGDGRYGFVNTPEEAASEFVGQLAGALRVAASDVKMQVEFNPNRVTTWRQIGYAKHQLTKQQFRDNKVDAAEIGAAESGNALYVIETNPNGQGPIATVRARFRVPQTSDYREHEWVVPFGSVVELEQSSPSLRLAASASAFSEWLASSPFAGDVSTDRLLKIVSGVPETYGADPRPKKLEWMIRQAKSISGK